jgi:hypothetical protein
LLGRDSEDLQSRLLTGTSLSAIQVNGCAECIFVRQPFLMG